MIEGACLCGAVTIRVADHEDRVGACHCRMCRVWGGASTAAFEAAAASVDVSGDVKRYRGSSFAERAFCPGCGTHLWIRDNDGPYDLMPGLFEAARAFPLRSEIYIDRAFASARLEGGHLRLTAAAWEAEHRHVTEETRP